jgi:hypothetical protein
VSDQEAPPRRIPWPTIIVLGLAVFGAISLVNFVLGLAFTLARLLIVVAIVALAVLFFRGPPDGGRS